MRAARLAGLVVVATLTLTTPASAAWEYIHQWPAGNGLAMGIAAGQGDRIYHAALRGTSDPSYVEVVAGLDHATQTPGTLLDTIGATGDPGTDGNFHHPVDVETDADGTVYVLDRGSSHTGAGPRVQAFEPDGTFKWSLGSAGEDQGGHFTTPTGVEVSADGIYVLDEGNHRVQQFSKATRAFVRMWGKDVGGTGVHVCTAAASCHAGDSSTADGFFWSPSGIAIDPAGNVFVGDVITGDVQKFTSLGAYVTKLTGFDGVNDIGFHPDGRLFVLGAREGDPSLHLVWEYGSDLQLDSSFAPSGTGPGQLDTPVGLDVDAKGYLYVTDLDTDLISAFSETGPPDDDGGDDDGDGGGAGGGGGGGGGGDTTPPPGDPGPGIVSAPLDPAPQAILPPNPPRVVRPAKRTLTVDPFGRIDSGIVLVCATPPGTACVSRTGVAYRCSAAGCARSAATVKVASSRFTTQAGKSAKVRFKLNARGRRLLKKRKRMKVTVTVTSSRVGAAPVKVKLDLTLKLRRR